MLLYSLLILCFATLTQCNEARTNGLPLNEVLLAKTEDLPLPCAKLLADVGADGNCPDFSHVMAQFRVVLLNVTTISVDGYRIISKTFSDSAFGCGGTINPFSAFRCFLRAFREAVTNLGTLTTELKEVTTQFKLLYTIFEQYSTGCKTDPKLRLLTICKQNSA